MLLLNLLIDLTTLATVLKRFTLLFLDNSELNMRLLLKFL